VTRVVRIDEKRREEKRREGIPSSEIR